MIVDVALALHLAAAAGYWWIMPKGFPPDSSRFWLNSVFPIGLIGIAFAGLIGIHRRHWSLAAAAVLFFASTWCAGAIAGRVVFPASLRGIWLVALTIAVVGYVCFWKLISGEPPAYRQCVMSATAGAIVGLFAIWAQIPPAASTEPMNAQPPQSIAQKRKPLSASILRPRGDFFFDAAAAELTMATRGVQIGCLPMLNFERLSADGFWSLLAPSREERRVPTVNEIGEAVQTVHYNDGTVVALSAPTAEGLLRLTAFTLVPHEVFSHLNTYCYFQISGHKKLSLSFSPCPSAQIEVLPADYPIGRPARFAYLDNAQNFCVVEATSGEKGPFHQLAVGRLERGQALTITVRDEGQPVAWITLEDWSRQLSTELSPTAGWKVPMNAVEFQLFDDDRTSPAAIWITLAATPVGRGWDTVGHRAGVYRNRIVLRSKEPQDMEGK
jgi:hypothetical protein